jgi:hypothetical protein
MWAVCLRYSKAKLHFWHNSFSQTYCWFSFLTATYTLFLKKMYEI